MTWDKPTPNKKCPNCGEPLYKRYTKLEKKYVCYKPGCGYEEELPQRKSKKKEAEGEGAETAAQALPLEQAEAQQAPAKKTTRKSAKKAEVRVIPAEGSVPFDLRDADVRYLVEDARGSGHAAQYYSYFQKFRFILRREGEGWRIDEVYSAAASQDRYRRDYYF